MIHGKWNEQTDNAIYLFNRNLWILIYIYKFITFIINIHHTI